MKAAHYYYNYYYYCYCVLLAHCCIVVRSSSCRFLVELKLKPCLVQFFSRQDFRAELLGPEQQWIVAPGVDGDRVGESGCYIAVTSESPEGAFASLSKGLKRRV